MKLYLPLITVLAFVSANVALAGELSAESTATNDTSAPSLDHSKKVSKKQKKYAKKDTKPAKKDTKPENSTDSISSFY